jgi:hypothetical protein
MALVGKFPKKFPCVEEKFLGSVGDSLFSHTAIGEGELKSAWPPGMGTPHHRLPCRNLNVNDVVGTFLSAFRFSAIR